MPTDPAAIDIDRMPRGGPDASWLDRRLQTNRLEYLDRDEVDDRVKRQVVRALERLGNLFKDHEMFARLALDEVADVADPTILELGSGHGGLSRKLLEIHPSAHVTITDIDPTSVAHIAAGDLNRHPRATVRVMVSNARGPDTLSSFVDPIGCKAGTPAEAAVFGDIVLLAIPLKAYHTVPVAQLEGRIVLDATNYHPERDGHIDELDRDEITTSELLGRHLPKSTIIKAFNAITAADIESDGLPSGWPGRRALPIAGDDDVAKKVVAELLDELGYDTVDAGPLVEGRRFQKNTPAYCIPMDFKGLHATVYNTFNPLAPRRTPLAAPDVGR